jgi:hypothetical protein
VEKTQVRQEESHSSSTIPQKQNTQRHRWSLGSVEDTVVWNEGVLQNELIKTWRRIWKSTLY